MKGTPFDVKWKQWKTENEYLKTINDVKQEFKCDKKRCLIDDKNDVDCRKIMTINDVKQEFKFDKNVILLTIKMMSIVEKLWRRMM